MIPFVRKYCESGEYLKNAKLKESTMYMIYYISGIIGILLCFMIPRNNLKSLQDIFDFVVVLNMLM